MSGESTMSKQDTVAVSAGVLVLERWHTFLVGALIGRKCGHASIGGACVSLNS